MGQLIVEAGAGGDFGGADTIGFDDFAAADLDVDLEEDLDFVCGGEGMNGT